MMQQRKFSLFLLVLLFFSAWSAKGQCPNNYSINIFTQPNCQNATNGYLTLQGTTYYSGSTYIWSNGATDRTLYNLSTGQYTVTVTDPTTCTYTATTYLAASAVGIPINITFSACQRQLYGGYASTNNPTYLWSDGSTGYMIQDPAPGVYTLTVTDVDGCTGVQTHTVLPYPSAIAATHTSTPATCNANNGSVDLTVTGGTPPYTYYWYGGGSGQSSQDAINLPVGFAGVNIRDANNCYLYYDVNIGGPMVTLPQAAYTSCGLTNNAILTATTQGMANPTFVWSNGATVATATGLTTGSYYTVTVTEGACAVTATASVYNGGFINVNIIDSTQNCILDEITASAYGGTFTYTYLWSTGETTREIGVQAGVLFYRVTVTDAVGCTATDVILTYGTSAGGLGFTSVVQDATCGNSDGTINLTVINGPANTYLWSPTGATTEDISGIAAGHHIVQATNLNGCVYTDTIAVGEFIEFSSTNASCGLNNGSVTVHDFGMTNPTFAWSNGATTATINNLSAGNYTVTVTNGSCVISESVTITDAGQVVANIFTPANCTPSYIAGMPTGGATPYTYLWSTGATTQSIANPTPTNTYDVTITDANGCTASATYTVPNPPAISATYVSTNATCNNKNGEIDLTVTGGTAPFNFAWSVGNGNVEDIVGLWPGQYSVNISDNNGCVYQLSGMVVGGQTAIAVSHVFTYVNAANTGGAINITVTGVTSATYQWSNGATTQDINNLSSGYYQVSITDLISGCVFTRQYYLPQPYVSNPNIRIAGYVYDVSATGLCQAGLPLPYEMVILQPLGLVDFTNAYGYYEFNITVPGNYTVEYVNTTPLTTTVVCPATGSYAITGAAQGNNFSNNFYLTNPPTQDLSINLWDWSNATPGFTYYTRIEYCNDGNTNMNGTVEYDYNSLLGFYSITGWNSTLTLHDIPNHKFYWSFSNLMPNQCRNLDVAFTVPTSTALGTSLVGTATVFPTAGDATPSNNTDTEQTVVVGSYDPNDKQVDLYHTGDAWTGGVIYETEEELEYTIRFQNTGTAPANVVVIRDTLDANLLPETVREISTKHDADVTLENGNILVFTFNNIYLPDSSADFAASMGFVKFKINRIAGLPVGTQIENTAAIYFDFNEPIITNTPISIIDAFNSVVDIDNSGLTVETMPNPFNEQLTLKYTLQESSDVTIRVMNAMGQTVYTHVAGQSQQNGVYVEQLRMNDLPSGMYLLSVETGEAIVTKKIVKQ